MMKTRFGRRLLVLGTLCMAPMAVLGGADAETAKWIEQLQAVGPEGKGNAEATTAWGGLSRLDADSLTTILAGMDGANPLAANWLRGAVGAIAWRTLEAGEKLPVAEFEKFFLDRSHSAPGRRLAYDWLVRIDPGATERLVPGMIDDPAPQMRIDAVARLMAEAEKEEAAEKKQEAKLAYHRALDAALDAGQVGRIAGRLRKLGEEIDIAAQFGFLLRWKIVGPFDNRAGENGRPRGFPAAYAPETIASLGAANFESSYDGKHGPVKWIDHTTNDPHGRVDLNAVVLEEKGVVAYAAAEFQSGSAQEAHVRLATPNAWKVWLNGELVRDRDEYHHGTRIDHYQAPCRLEKGRNLILLKVCQNEQTEDYAKPWQFQLRVCTPTGKAILATDRSRATAAAATPGEGE